jgi:hypothetical protein
MPKVYAYGLGTRAKTRGQCTGLTSLGLTQLRHLGSQRSVFACGSMVLADLLVYSFSARSAEKPYTIEKEHTTLPKAKDRRLRLSYFQKKRLMIVRNFK